MDDTWDKKYLRAMAVDEVAKAAGYITPHQLSVLLNFSSSSTNKIPQISIR